MAEVSPAESNPYPGPRPFTRNDKLYGRSREAHDLRCLLVAERIVLLYSPSGAGKTSLVQAALIPSLESDGFRVLGPVRVSLEPSAERAAIGAPNRYILSTLLSLEAGRPQDQQRELSALRGMKLADYLDQLPPYQPPPPDDDPTNGEEPEQWLGDVLIFDQFEEALTVDPTGEVAKREFFEQLGQALRNRNRWALFSMREEFIAGLDGYRLALPTRLTNRFRLDLLGLPAAKEAMRGPAAAANPKVDFTQGAADKLAQNLSKVRARRADGEVGFVDGLYVEPVQLQVVCRRLWGQARPDPLRIEASDIKDEGDVETALSEYYTESVRAVAAAGVRRAAGSDPSQAPDSAAEIAAKQAQREASIRDWIDARLITTSGLRGQVLLENEATLGLDEQTIRALVNTHLVRAEERRGFTWFELAHDRLIDPVRTQ